MALNSLHCAEVPLRNYSLTHPQCTTSIYQAFHGHTESLRELWSSILPNFIVWDQHDNHYTIKFWKFDTHKNVFYSMHIHIVCMSTVLYISTQKRRGWVVLRRQLKLFLWLRLSNVDSLMPAITSLSWCC